MSENITLPYILQWKENSLQLTEVEDTKNIEKVTQIAYLPSNVDESQQMYSLLPIQIEDIKPEYVTEQQMNYIFEVIPTQPSTQPIEKFKRGRPKKKKEKATTPAKPKEKATTPAKPKEKLSKDQPKVLKLAPRTRSGRVVKMPKHIVEDFEKLETNDSKKSELDNPVVKTTEFPRFLEPTPKTKPKDIQGLEFHQSRRKIAAQYRCPTCNKAYLGKTKMMQHIQKHPDHGPIPRDEKSELNFDVWNYLVDITQKCPQAQRGIKFCEELTNLMHNLLLLTSALFKEVKVNKNFVEVDKVLGNAIGLKPGSYSFNDNELYKDVTVLKLLTTTDFFKPNDSTREPPVQERVIKIRQENVAEPSEVVKTVEPNSSCDEPNSSCDTPQRAPEDIYFKQEPQENPKKVPSYCISKIEPAITSEINLVPDDDSIKKTETPHLDSEMLSDNSILHLSNIRTSVDDLMMATVDSGGTLLDNSTSSDEVMNVDQFVNERFNKITEPDLEIGSGSLNLDLPSLDLFEFHTS
ncbi:hypothetical protein JTB14_029755 [Gonioctena quinquepunctata]|nr:hypothetical protein JTB14_029755 [Gonioctena quinquepunctata]